jgi:hypothetical protein
MDFEQTLLESLDQLNEAISFASYMDVDELRLLYYGRTNILVSFSNDEKFETSGYESGRLIRPAGIVGYDIEDVVGRKIGSSTFYGHIYRDKVSNSDAIRDLQSYSQERMNRDLEEMKKLRYLDKYDLEEAIFEARNNPRLRRNFEIIWNVMRTVLRGKQDADVIWARIFQDLGYKAITDQRGHGYFSPVKVKSTIFFEERDIEQFDIVPIQKYRSDPRKNTRDRIDREVKRMRSRRRTVAKRENLNYERGTSKSLIKGFIGSLLA